MKAELKLWRGTPGSAGRYERYEVPFEPGQTVLDALRWIRVHHDLHYAPCRAGNDARAVAEQGADQGPRHRDCAAGRAS
ncbi:MAG: hypothetical protein E6H57_18000 [Betaproteobacteria bacterium]|nr:MAG: hypothetical protein E6H57_18000 [Betaproteobacteria bacterium]